MCIPKEGSWACVSGSRGLLFTLLASKQGHGRVCGVTFISAGHSALSGDADSLLHDRGGRDWGGRARSQVFDTNITCRTGCCASMVTGVVI